MKEVYREVLLATSKRLGMGGCFSVLCVAAQLRCVFGLTRCTRWTRPDVIPDSPHIDLWHLQKAGVSIPIEGDRTRKARQAGAALLGLGLRPAVKRRANEFVFLTLMANVSERSGG